MLSTAYLHKGPASVRYPRGSGPDIKVDKSLKALEIGKANLISERDSGITILNFGALLTNAKEIADDLGATLVDMRFVKPLDKSLLNRLLKKSKVFISIEDGSIMGGAGSAVQEFASNENLNIKSILFGIPDKFIEHASRDEMLVDAGLDIKSIRSKLSKVL